MKTLAYCFIFVFFCKNCTSVIDRPVIPFSDTITICSFNVQFLGHFKSRDDEALAKLVKDYDIVVIQELIAPPFEGTFPDSTSFVPDNEAAEFFNAMGACNLSYVLSSEDTGPGR